DGYEVLSETALGRKLHYAVPRIGGPFFKFVMPVNAYPWYATKDGVEVKPFAAFNANGPFMKLVRLLEGAALKGGVFQSPRFVAIATGAVRYDGTELSDLHAVFAPAGTEF